jgi:membrane protein DedA with SNARE-associated domain
MQHATQMSELRFEAMRGDVSETRRVVRLRDVSFLFLLLLGSLASVVFHWLTGDSLGWLSQLGVLSFVVAGAVIAIALLKARKIARSDDWTLRSRLESEIEYLERQKKLGYDAGSRFLAPMLPAIVLLSLGGYHDQTGSYAPGPSLWVYYLVCVVVYGLTYWLCRREAERSLGPLLTKLKSLHRELVEN